MEIKVNNSQMEVIQGLKPDYPYTMHRISHFWTEIPWHWHEELEFIYVTNGELKLHTYDKTYCFQKGEAFFMNADTLCSMENVKQCSFESHLFSPVFLSGHFKSIFETKYIKPVLQNKKVEIVSFWTETENQKRTAEKLRRLGMLQDQENVEFQTRNLLSEIWLLLLKEIQSMEGPNIKEKSVNKERLQTMMAYIHENYGKKLTLEEIADSACVSKRECLRCFQKGIQKSPFAYLTEYRMERAKKALRTTNLPITRIALESGFSSGAYFSKIFRRECGKTPGEYRAKTKKEGELE